MRYFIGCMILLLNTLCLQAHTQISGRITDAKTNTPLPGVNVVILGARLGAVTDKDGVFTISSVPNAPYTLRISFVGYQTQELQIGATQTFPIQIGLKEQAFKGDEVVVTATRSEKFKRDVPVVVNVVDDEIFEATQSVNLAEGLIYQPALRVETNCQNCSFSQVRLNGMEGGYSQILIDGRPIFSALDGVYGLDQMPTAMIERVEVVRGGGSALFGGNAIAGTINIITKEPINTGFEVATNQSFIGGDEPDRNYTMNASFVSDDQLTGLSVFGVVRNRNHYDHDGDGFSEITTLQNQSFGARAFYRTGPLSKFIVDIHHLYEDRRGGNRFEFEPHEADIAEALTHKVWGGGISYETLFATDRTHAFTVYISGRRTDRDSYYGAGRDPNAYGMTQNRTLAAGAKYAIAVGSVQNNELTFGIDAQIDHLEDEMPAYNRLTDQTIKQAGFYAQSDWEMTEKFTMLLGVRIDNHSKMNGPVINPRTNLLLKATDRLQFRVSGAMGFRAPQAFDEDLHIESVGGEALLIERSPDLGPERSSSYTGSIDYSDNERQLPYGITLEGFYTQLNDPFILEEGSPDANGNKILIKKNGGGAVVKGITLDARAFFTTTFQLLGGFTMQSGRYNDPVEWADDLFSDRILRAPTVYGYYTAIWQAHPVVNLSVSGTYTGPMYAPHFAGYIAEDRLEKTPSFFETNVKIDFDLEFGPTIPELEIQFGIQNIFNSYQSDFDQGINRDAGYVYGPGRPRTFYTGIKVMH